MKFGRTIPLRKLQDISLATGQSRAVMATNQMIPTVGTGDREADSRGCFVVQSCRLGLSCKNLTLRSNLH